MIAVLPARVSNQMRRLQGNPLAASVSADIAFSQQVAENNGLRKQSLHNRHQQPTRGRSSCDVIVVDVGAAAAIARSPGQWSGQPSIRFDGDPPQPIKPIGTESSA